MPVAHVLAVFAARICAWCHHEDICTTHFSLLGHTSLLLGAAGFSDANLRGCAKHHERWTHTYAQSRLALLSGGCACLLIRIVVISQDERLLHCAAFPNKAIVANHTAADLGALRTDMICQSRPSMLIGSFSTEPLDENQSIWAGNWVTHSNDSALANEGVLDVTAADEGGWAAHTKGTDKHTSRRQACHRALRLALQYRKAPRMPWVPHPEYTALANEGVLNLAAADEGRRQHLPAAHNALLDLVKLDWCPRHRQLQIHLIEVSQAMYILHQNHEGIMTFCISKCMSASGFSCHANDQTYA